MKKRGQITVFIILGLILLLSTALYITLTKEMNIFSSKEKIPPELNPLKIYIEGCIEEKAEPGIMLLGLQGGYIEIPENLASPDKHLSLPPKIPYWYYDKKSKTERREFMQKELENYIKKELPECINLKTFEDRFDIKSLSELNPKVKINLDSVVIELAYPLEVVEKGTLKKTTISKFSKEIPIRLGRMQELAEDIMQEENLNSFLEQLTMDMIATANTDNGRFPYEGTEITCSSRIWSISKQLKPDLQNILKYNFHFLRFAGAGFNPILPGMYNLNENGKITDLNNELNDYYYTSRNRPDLILPSGEYPERRDYKISYLINLGKTYSGIKVDTLYEPSFGMMLDVYPKSGDFVKPMELPIPLIGSCFKVYHHFYTLKYPLLFMITDVKNPGRPFVFNLATPVIIDKNQPNRQQTPYSIDTDFDAVSQDKYCSREDKMVEVKVKDEYTGGSVENAEVSFQCLNFVCEMGKTEREKLGGIPIGTPKTRGYFPMCINGLLKIKKQGYLDYEKFISIGDKENPIENHACGSSDGAPVLCVELTPLKKLDYEFKILEITNNVITNSRAPSEGETVYLTMKNNEKDYEVNVVYPLAFEGLSEKELIDSEGLKQFIDLNLINANSKYDLSIKLMKNNNIIGGYEIVDFEITRNQLMSASKIVFNILVKQPIPTDNEAMANVWVNFIQPESKKQIYKPKIK